MPDFLIETDEFDTLAGDILQNGRRLRFRARGSSMRPFILDNDIIEVEKVELTSLSRGDVVLCRLNNDRLVVHRVIRANHESLLIQGDALPLPDGLIPRASVLGKIDVITRNGKRIPLNNFWTAILVSIWLAFTPFRNFMLRVLFRFQRTIRKENPEEIANQI